MKNMTLFMTFMTLFMTLSGCATTRYQPAIQHFEDTQNRPRSRVILDQARCGSYNGQIDNGDEELYEACMDQLGYKMVIDKPAEKTTTKSYNPLSWL